MEVLMEVPSTRSNQVSLVGALEKYCVFTALVLTTVLSSLLLAGDVHHWILPKSLFDFVVGNRASTQLIVQVCANVLGLVHVTVLCALVNYSTRLRLAVVATSLDALRFWTDLLSRRVDWTIPFRFLFPLLAFIAICIAPSALWAGAITPISVTAFRQQIIPLPVYSSPAYLYQDGNWTHREGGPFVRNIKGFFTYNIGEEYLGTLLASASSATTVDGSVRQHAKIDFSRFTYNGRSYGVGASIGLVDDDITLDPLATQYTFKEVGYAPMVSCIYNTSSAYYLNPTPRSYLVYEALGFLPNSHPWQGEFSEYTGFNYSTIVAIGVASAPDAVGRMIGIAAGYSYEMLNNTQCTIDFQPALFNVTVDLVLRKITVARIEAAINTPDIEPSGWLSFLATWQMTLISTDQTSLYTSLVGNSINASVNNYIASAPGTASDPISEAEATLGGLGNSVTAMIDDILTAYASAQLMIANDTQTTSASVGYQAQRLGQRVYIISVTILNGVIVLLVLAEAIRTRAWKGLVDFDYMDPRNLIIASSRGGEGIANTADDIGAHEVLNKNWANADAYNIGRIRILQEESTLVLAQSTNRLTPEDHSKFPATIEVLEESREATSLDEGTEGLSPNEVTELLTQEERREELNPGEEREAVNTNLGEKRLLPRATI